MSQPARATLPRRLPGPTSDLEANLRAPTLRKGWTLLVGFDEATYTQVLG